MSHPVNTVQTTPCTYARPGPGPTGTHRLSDKALRIYENLLRLYTHHFKAQPVQVKGSHTRPLVSGQRESCRPPKRPWLIHWSSVLHEGFNPI